MPVVWNVLQNHLARTPWAFAFWMGFEGLTVRQIASLALSTLGATRTDLNNLGYLDGLLLLVVVAPLMETFLFQMLPIAFARWWRVTIVSQIVVSTLLFALAHLPAGVSAGVCAGIL